MTDRRLLELLRHATLPCTLPPTGGRPGEGSCGRCPNCRITAELLKRERLLKEVRRSSDT